jgi:PEP-CTERM motif
VHLMLALAFLLAGAGVARADTIDIRINDLMDTVTFNVTGATAFPQPDNNPSGEYIHFIINFPEEQDDEPFVVVRDMLESAGGPVSDRLVATFDIDFLDVKFASDPATLTIPLFGNVNILQAVVEDGTFQPLLSNVNVFFAYTGGFTNTYSISVASDAGDVPGDPVSTVPEPSTLTLLGTGVIGLYSWRRRRESKLH